MGKVAELDDSLQLIREREGVADKKIEELAEENERLREQVRCLQACPVV